jgi:hypothetical protein
VDAALKCAWNFMGQENRERKKISIILCNIWKYEAKQRAVNHKYGAEQKISRNTFLEIPSDYVEKDV